MFLAGIDQMVTDEKWLLLAQLESINSMLLLRDKAMDEALKIKKWVAQTGSRLAGRIRQESWQDKINDLDRKTDWDVKGLQEAIDKSLRDVSRYEEYEVQAYLKEELAGLVDLSRAIRMMTIELECFIIWLNNISCQLWMTAMLWHWKKNCLHCVCRNNWIF